MFLSLTGCGKKTQRTCEEIAQSYLEKTYRKEFGVEELSKKESGPFLTKEYSGFAYEKEQPLNRFKIWVNKEKQTVEDTYYSIQLLPELNAWIQEQAVRVWGEARTAVVLEVFHYDEAGLEAGEDFRTFLQEESAELTIWLFLCDKTLSAEKYMEFSAPIGELANGYVRIFCLDKTEYETLDINSYLKKMPDYSINLRASQKVTEEKLQ